ncbi:MAG: XRE family transcriptional regulator [Bifidobacterium bifidum]|nr:XRE family transcriptional regulator [Bifidobacterium bifidum]
MCNNIMVCKFLIQDLKLSLCIANLVRMTAVRVSPALKAQKQELSLQDRVTYNMKVLIAIRQTSQKDLAQAMGIAAPTLSQKFSGRTRWNMDDIEKASDFLDVKPEALVAGHGFEPWYLWVMIPTGPKIRRPEP